MQKNRYQLRCAAGKYWLLDMEQDGETYRPPLMLNESGAYIFRQYMACLLYTSSLKPDGKKSGKRVLCVTRLFTRKW